MKSPTGFFQLTVPVSYCPTLPSLVYNTSYFTQKYDIDTLYELLILFCNDAIYNGQKHALPLSTVTATLQKKKENTHNIEYSVNFEGKHVSYYTNSFPWH